MPSFSNGLQSAMNFLLPTLGGYSVQLTTRDTPTMDKRNLTSYISPVQLARIRQDIQTWRDCITEAENAWYPQRVKMQRLFMDTILNGHVFACMDRRSKLTMLKDWKIVTGPEDSPVEHPELNLMFKKKWFRDYMFFALQAKAFGYQLIYLGDLVNDEFPNLSIIRRFNISPDRLNVTQFVYSISGAPFLDEPYRDWHIWVPTPTDVGVSPVGYGYLYKVAFYEILARNVVTQNADATEMYGMPIRVGKTNKAQESAERAIFETALAEMGSAGYLLMDSVGDSIELMESKSLGNGYKIYESLEARLEKKISKIILGHSDAMDSVPGKLGNDSTTSPAQVALRDTATTDMNDLADLTTNVLFPKLRTLGFIIPDDARFIFDNNEETQQVRADEDAANLGTATVFKMIKDAGGDPDWQYFSDRTGIKTEKVIPPAPIMAPGIPGTPGAKPVPGAPAAGAKKPAVVDDKVKARIEQLYGTGRVRVNGNGHIHAH